MASYNIKFPLRDDISTNTFLLLSKINKDAYSSNLILLLLTQKGERYYEPDYGTNLLKYIFEPNDNITATDVEQEIKRTVSTYIPELTITKVNFNWKQNEDNQPISDNQLNIKIEFVYNEDTFNESGELELNF